VAGIRASCPVTDVPLKVAVNTAVSAALMAAAVAEKMAVLDAAAIVTLAGTVTFEVLLVRVTVVPVAAGLDSVSVHEAVASEPICAGEHTREVNTGAAVSDMEADRELLPYVAVTCAV
jgi:hypothetical protein